MSKVDMLKDGLQPNEMKNIDLLKGLKAEDLPQPSKEIIENQFKKVLKEVKERNISLYEYVETISKYKPTEWRYDIAIIQLYWKIHWLYNVDIDWRTWPETRKLLNSDLVKSLEEWKVKKEKTEEKSESKSMSELQKELHNAIDEQSSILLEIEQIKSSRDIYKESKLKEANKRLQVAVDKIRWAVDQINNYKEWPVSWKEDNKPTRPHTQVQEKPQTQKEENKPSHSLKPKPQVEPRPQTLPAQKPEETKPAESKPEADQKPEMIGEYRAALDLLKDKDLNKLLKNKQAYDFVIDSIKNKKEMPKELISALKESMVKFINENALTKFKAKDIALTVNEEGNLEVDKYILIVQPTDTFVVQEKVVKPVQTPVTEVKPTPIPEQKPADPQETEKVRNKFNELKKEIDGLIKTLLPLTKENKTLIEKTIFNWIALENWTFGFQDVFNSLKALKLNTLSKDDIESNTEELVKIKDKAEKTISIIKFLVTINSNINWIIKSKSQKERTENINSMTLKLSVISNIKLLGDEEPLVNMKENFVSLSWADVAKFGFVIGNDTWKNWVERQSIFEKPQWTFKLSYEFLMNADASLAPQESVWKAEEEVSSLNNIKKQINDLAFRPNDRQNIIELYNILKSAQNNKLWNKQLSISKTELTKIVDTKSEVAKKLFNDKNITSDKSNYKLSIDTLMTLFDNKLVNTHRSLNELITPVEFDKLKEFWFTKREDSILDTKNYETIYVNWVKVDVDANLNLPYSLAFDLYTSEVKFNLEGNKLTFDLTNFTWTKDKVEIVLKQKKVEATTPKLEDDPQFKRVKSEVVEYVNAMQNSTQSSIYESEILKSLNQLKAMGYDLSKDHFIIDKRNQNIKNENWFKSAVKNPSLVDSTTDSQLSIKRWKNILNIEIDQYHISYDFMLKLLSDAQTQATVVPWVETAKTWADSIIANLNKINLNNLDKWREEILKQIDETKKYVNSFKDDQKRKVNSILSKSKLEVDWVETSLFSLLKSSELKEILPKMNKNKLQELINELRDSLKDIKEVK